MVPQDMSLMERKVIIMMAIMNTKVSPSYSTKEIHYFTEMPIELLIQLYETYGDNYEYGKLIKQTLTL